MRPTVSINWLQGSFWGDTLFHSLYLSSRITCEPSPFRWHHGGDVKPPFTYVITTDMKNEIRNGKVIWHRIYFQDRYTNKIWYLETKGTVVSYDKLDVYLKENNKKFLYITNIVKTR